jgi:hypothetical protein
MVKQWLTGSLYIEGVHAFNFRFVARGIVSVAGGDLPASGRRYSCSWWCCLLSPVKMVL